VLFSDDGVAGMWPAAVRPGDLGWIETLSPAIIFEVLSEGGVFNVRTLKGEVVAVSGYALSSICSADASEAFEDLIDRTSREGVV
jgi:hypothetical protein